MPPFSRMIIIAIVSLLSGVQSYVVTADKEALDKIYEATVGSSWKSSVEGCAGSTCTTDETTAGKMIGGLNRPWDNTTDPCVFGKNWYGVGCYDACDFFRDGPDCYRGRITSLNLWSNNLHGSIPAEIGVLTNLTLLNLAKNNLTGAIPTEITNIKNVEIIDLHDNQLTGEIPPAICSNQGVTNYLNVNKLSIKYSCYELYLSHNLLTGAIPAELGSVQSLKFLDVSYNTLSGSLPDEIFQVGKLQTLHFHHNSITGAIPSTVGGATRLRFLRGNNNLLTGAIPDAVGNLTMLYELSLYNNQLSGPLGNWSKTNNLRFLKLADNQLTGTVPDTFADMPNLEHVDLYNNVFEGDMPKSLTTLTHLRYLFLQNEQLTPLRQKYCKQRLPHKSMQKHNYVWIKDEYEHMINMQCDDMHSTEFTFNALPEGY